MALQPTPKASSVTITDKTNRLLTRQERRERKALRLKRAILKTLKHHGASLAVLVTLVALSAQPTYADTIFERVARQVETIFTGPLVRSIAIIAIVITGIGAATGRISMEAVLIVAGGIALMLGAVSIVAMFA